MTEPLLGIADHTVNVGIGEPHRAADPGMAVGVLVQGQRSDPLVDVCLDQAAGLEGITAVGFRHHQRGMRPVRLGDVLDRHAEAAGAVHQQHIALAQGARKHLGCAGRRKSPPLPRLRQKPRQVLSDPSQQPLHAELPCPLRILYLCHLCRAGRVPGISRVCGTVRSSGPTRQSRGSVLCTGPEPHPRPCDGNDAGWEAGSRHPPGGACRRPGWR